MPKYFVSNENSNRHESQYLYPDDKPDQVIYNLLLAKGLASQINFNTICPQSILVIDILLGCL